MSKAGHQHIRSFYPRRRYKRRHYEGTYDNFIVLLYISIIQIPVLHAQSTSSTLNSIFLPASVTREQALITSLAPLGVVSSIVASPTSLSSVISLGSLSLSMSLMSSGNSSASASTHPSGTSALTSNHTTTTLTSTIGLSTTDPPTMSTSLDADSVYNVRFKIVYLLPGAIIVVAILILSIVVILIRKCRRRRRNIVFPPVHTHPFPADGGRFDFYDNRDDDERLWARRCPSETEDEYQTDDDDLQLSSRSSVPHFDDRPFLQTSTAASTLLMDERHSRKSISARNSLVNPRNEVPKHSESIPISESFYEQGYHNDNLDEISLSDEPPVSHLRYHDYTVIEDNTHNLVQAAIVHKRIDGNLGSPSPFQRPVTKTGHLYHEDEGISRRASKPPHRSESIQLPPSLQIRYRPSNDLNFSPVLSPLSPPLMQDLFFLDRRAPVTTHCEGVKGPPQDDEGDEANHIYNAILKAGQPHYMTEDASMHSQTSQGESLPISTSVLSIVPNTRRLIRSQRNQRGRGGIPTNLTVDYAIKSKSYALTRQIQPLNLRNGPSQMNTESVS